MNLLMMEPISIDLKISIIPSAQLTVEKFSPCSDNQLLITTWEVARD